MERLMQYVWQHRLWMPDDMYTVDGQRVTVIDPGLLNTDAGPDFFNAKVRIGGCEWVGNIEIHVNASDWHRHGHDNDPAYSNVILHIVDRDDVAIRRPNGDVIPQMRMPCLPEFHRIYGDLIGHADIDIPCAPEIPRMEKIHLVNWIDRLAFERLHDKSRRITDLLERLGGDWESAAYVTVARSLGFGLNSEPFERLALSVPLRLLGRHADSITTIEAILLGQSGLLEGITATDSYTERMLSEYSFMRHKFGLRPLENPGWKMARTRPANFPHRRIAVLAAMIHGGFRMLSRIIDANDIEDIKAIFSPQITGYWYDHYTFGSASRYASSQLSFSSVASLGINVVAPLQYAYATTHGLTPLADKALELLESLPAEHNRIVDAFVRAGIPAQNAFVSQALIQLRRCYCEQRKCLYCRIGHRMLSRRVRRPDPK